MVVLRQSASGDGSQQQQLESLLNRKDGNSNTNTMQNETNNNTGNSNNNNNNNNNGKIDLLDTPPPTKGGVSGKSLFFFLILIGQSIGTQLYFKLSQRGGKYEYNTMSAMFLVEFIKLSISITQLMVGNRGNVQECVGQFKSVSKRVYAAYLALALSYAMYNQCIFYVMKLVDPGTFTLFKSLMPGVVAFLNYIAFSKCLSQAQIFCIIIQIFGIVPVTVSPDSESGKIEFTYGVGSIVVMMGIIVYGAFNTIYNASVVKKESANSPIAVQNGILYTGGCFFNLLFYFCTRKPGADPFFYGFNNINVFILLIFNSSVGVIISMVYKYGDAVLKTLSQPVVSAVLLILSNILFDTPLDIVKMSGAGSVIVSTMLYLQLPSPPEVEPKDNDGSGLRARMMNKSKWLFVGLLVIVCYALMSFMNGSKESDMEGEGGRETAGLRGSMEEGEAIP